MASATMALVAVSYYEAAELSSGAAPFSRVGRTSCTVRTSRMI
jgi:hypothetical protein